MADDISKLEDEKILVAEKLMGWKQFKTGAGDGTFSLHWVFRHNKQPVKDWNPQDDAKATYKEWAEMWEKMDAIQRNQYYRQILIIERNYDFMAVRKSIEEALSFDSMDMHIMHTVKPSICWKALIKTLEA